MQGLVSRLRQYSRQFELLVIELATPNFCKQIFEFQPEIIIFEEGDIKDALPHSLVDLLNFLPQAVLLELRMDDQDVQMIQSVRFTPSNAEELVQIFKTSDIFSTAASVQVR